MDTRLVQYLPVPLFLAFLRHCCPAPLSEPSDQHLFAPASPVAALPDAGHVLICLQPTQLLYFAVHVFQFIALGTFLLFE